VSEAPLPKIQILENQGRLNIIVKFFWFFFNVYHVLKNGFGPSLLPVPPIRKLDFWSANRPILYFSVSVFLAPDCGFMLYNLVAPFCLTYFGFLTPESAPPAPIRVAFWSIPIAPIAVRHCRVRSVAYPLRPRANGRFNIPLTKEMEAPKLGDIKLSTTIILNTNCTVRLVRFVSLFVYPCVAVQ